MVEERLEHSVTPVSGQHVDRLDPQEQAVSPVAPLGRRHELTDGPSAGRYVYVAEQITGLPRVGQTLRAGDVIAHYAKKGTCIEMGWSAADGETQAQATTGYTEGEVTVAGVSFARVLISLGVQGMFDLVPAHATRVKPGKKHHPTHAARH